MFTNIRFQCPLVESFNQPVTKFAFEKMERAQIVGGFLLEGCICDIQSINISANNHVLCKDIVK